MKIARKNYFRTSKTILIPNLAQAWCNMNNKCNFIIYFQRKLITAKRKLECRKNRKAISQVISNRCDIPCTNWWGDTTQLVENLEIPVLQHSYNLFSIIKLLFHDVRKMKKWKIKILMIKTIYHVLKSGHPIKKV